MNINYIEYSIFTESLDIFFAGCKNKCKDCCNPELMNFDNGTDFKSWLPKISHYLDDYGTLIRRIFLVGGSPNHQNLEDMEEFLSYLEENYKNLDIYAFCGEELDTVNPVIKRYCPFIKVGAYIPELTVKGNVQEGIVLATSNQRILSKAKGDY